MKRKVFLILCLMFVFITLCYACGKKDTKQEASTNNKEKQEDVKIEKETEDESSKKPDEERMLNDLKENNCNKIVFTNWDKEITIPIVESKLEKAKGDDESYIAYYILNLENEYYKAELKYSLTYGYYDIGGWMLDECKEESRKIESVKPDDVVIQEHIKNVCVNEGWNEPDSLTLSTYEIVENEKDYTWNCSYFKVDERNFADILYEDRLVCCFDQEKGWEFGGLTSSYLSDDWTKIVGKKFFTGEIDGEYFYLDVLDVNTFSMTVELKISGHTDRGYRLKAGGAYEEDEDKMWTDYVDRVIYDIPETIFTAELERSSDIEDYYFIKDADDAYVNSYTYSLQLSEETTPAEVSFSMYWDCDNGISYFSGFFEHWKGGLQEIN